MRKAILFLLSLLLGFASGSDALDRADTIPVDRIQRGLQGYGLTVLEGTRIDTFQVEVLDVMRGSGGTGDMILVRVSGLGLEESGIAQGMSGSPIFLGGRLAGALAFAYPFAQKPIAGVTPIGEMIDVWEREDAEGAAGGVLSPPSGGYEAFGQGPEPIATPLALSGFAPGLAGEVEEFFRSYGMVATAGGAGGGEGEDDGWSPSPGSAIGVRLLSGDANLTGIGTVTWVEGDRVLAFGHPMFQAGSVRFPLVSVGVHTLIASRYVSFKLGSPIDDVGTLVEDRRPGVAGRLGEIAPTIPVEVRVVVPGIRTDQYTYKVLEDRSLTPVLISWAVRNSILHREKAAGEKTIRVRLSLELEGTEHFERENVYASGSALGDVSDDLLLPLQVLANNRIAAPEIRSVAVDVEVSGGRRLARIEELEMEKDAVRPGEDVRGRITLRHYQGEPETVPFRLSLPADIPEGEYLLRVCDAASSEEWETKRMPGRFAAKRIDQLVRILADLRTNDGIYLQLYADDPGATVDGREMPNLPASVLAVLGGGLHADDAAFVKSRVVASETIRRSEVVVGCGSLSVKVDREAP